MTESTRTPLARPLFVRLARWWWLLVSAIWIVGFSLLLKWSPTEEIVYRQPIEQVALPDATAAEVAAQPGIPFLTDDSEGPPDQRRAEVRAQQRGEAYLGINRPDCWSDIYSVPDAAGHEMQWRCETRASWARMIVTNVLVLASFPFLLPLAIMGVLRTGRRITRGSAN